MVSGIVILVAGMVYTGKWHDLYWYLAWFTLMSGMTFNVIWHGLLWYLAWFILVSGMIFAGI